jgi:PAS domain S-box-containing protein
MQELLVHYASVGNFLLLLIVLALVCFYLYKQPYKIIQRQMDEELRLSEIKYTLLVNSVRDYAIFMLDPDGRVTTWNAGAEVINGYRAVEIIGKHFSVFYTADNVNSRWPEHELEEATKFGSFEDEGWRVKKDGSKFWANVIITSLRASNGKLVGFAKIVRDLSIRKDKEEKINQLNLSLTTRLDALEAFNQSVSHDLNAPLRSIDGFSEILAQDYADKLDDKGNDYIKRIRASVIYMRQLIRDMMRLAVVTKPNTELNITQVSLTNAFRMVAGEYKMAETTRTIEVNIQQNMAVSADPELIGLVVGNLFDNAWKYTNRNHNARIDIGSTDIDGQTVYYIKDNGVGFDQSQVNKLFQPFSRLHRDFEGTGIGLTIVKRVIELHRGKVWAEGKVGEGATFYFTIGT